MDREAEFLLRLESEKSRRAIFREGKKKIAALAEALLKAEEAAGAGASIRQIERLRPAGGQKREGAA